MMCICDWAIVVRFVFCQAEDGIRDLVRSRGLGDVYKRQPTNDSRPTASSSPLVPLGWHLFGSPSGSPALVWRCLLYTSDAADERSSVDLGGSRIIKQKKTEKKNITYSNINIHM